MDSKGQQLLAASFDEVVGARRDRLADDVPQRQAVRGRPQDATTSCGRSATRSTAPSRPTCENIPGRGRRSTRRSSRTRAAPKCNIDPLEGQLTSVFEGLKVKKVDYMTPEGKALYAELTQADPSRSKTLPTILFDEHGRRRQGRQCADRALPAPGRHVPGARARRLLRSDRRDLRQQGRRRQRRQGRLRRRRPARKRWRAARRCKKTARPVRHVALPVRHEGDARRRRSSRTRSARTRRSTVHYIGDNKNGQLTSMHGPDEVTDDLREVCAIQHYAPEREVPRLPRVPQQGPQGRLAGLHRARPASTPT